MSYVYAFIFFKTCPWSEFFFTSPHFINFIDVAPKIQIISLLIHFLDISSKTILIKFFRLDKSRGECYIPLCWLHSRAQAYTTFTLLSPLLCAFAPTAAVIQSITVSLSMPVPMYRANKHNRHLMEYFSSLKYDSNLRALDPWHKPRGSPGTF